MQSDSMRLCACGCGAPLPPTAERKSRFIHNHYQRSHATPVPDRFWQKVEKTDTCWLWVASRNRQGYGQFFLKKLRPDYPLMVRANRFSWELHHGPVPSGMQVCHTCDNPPCVNPAHLFLGDHKANADDRDRKGRLKTPLVKGHTIRRMYNGKPASR